jgi:signal-transduction protein with cAMP-binding, CBS, and nucleotidyltransferase domain
MTAVRVSRRILESLKNISWLTARQLNKLSNALTVSTVEKREIIFDEKHSPDSVYILLAGFSSQPCRDSQE